MKQEKCKFCKAKVYAAKLCELHYYRELKELKKEKFLGRMGVV